MAYCPRTNNWRSYPSGILLWLVLQPTYRSSNKKLHVLFDILEYWINCLSAVQSHGCWIKELMLYDCVYRQVFDVSWYPSDLPWIVSFFLFSLQHILVHCVNPLPQIYVYNAQYDKTLNVTHVCLLLCGTIMQEAFKFQFSTHRYGHLILVLKG